MPTFTRRTELPRVSASRVWDVLCDFERYPEIMPDVLSVRVTEREGPVWVSEWQVMLSGNRMEWTERSITDEAARRMAFEQVEGDMEVFRGEWRLAQEGENVVVDLEICFDFGLPALAEIIDPAATVLLSDNFGRLIEAVGAEASARAG